MASTSVYQCMSLYVCMSMHVNKVKDDGQNKIKKGIVGVCISMSVNI